MSRPKWADPPPEPGWYCVCQHTDFDFTEECGPLCPPRMVYWEGGGSEDIIYDPLGRGGGGIQGLESVAWWGERVKGVPLPEERRRIQESHF